MSDLEDLVAQLNKEIANLRAKCDVKDHEFAQQVAFTDKIIAKLRLELEALKHG